MSETIDEPDGLSRYRELQTLYCRRFREITEEHRRRGRLAGAGVYSGLPSWSREDLEWRAEMLFALNELAAKIPGFSREERKRVDEGVWNLVDGEPARRGNAGES